jgi:hypothetical protein
MAGNRRLDDLAWSVEAAKEAVEGVWGQLCRRVEDADLSDRVNEWLVRIVGLMFCLDEAEQNLASADSQRWRDLGRRCISVGPWRSSRRSWSRRQEDFSEMALDIIDRGMGLGRGHPGVREAPAGTGGGRGGGFGHFGQPSPERRRPSL